MFLAPLTTKKCHIGLFSAGSNWHMHRTAAKHAKSFFPTLMMSGTAQEDADQHRMQTDTTKIPVRLLCATQKWLRENEAAQDDCYREKVISQVPGSGSTEDKFAKELLRNRGHRTFRERIQVPCMGLVQIQQVFCPDLGVREKTSDIIAGNSHRDFLGGQGMWPRSDNGSHEFTAETTTGSTSGHMTTFMGTTCFDDFANSLRSISVILFISISTSRSRCPKHM